MTVSTEARRSTGPGCAALVLLLVSCCQPRMAAAQDFSPEQVKAAYLYRFTSYIEWPANSLGPASFTIAVQCDDEVATALRQVVQDRQIKGLPVQVRQLARTSEIEGVQVLYIGPDCKRGIDHELAQLASKPILVVTDDVTGIQNSGTITFLTTNDHVRFAVSLRAAKLSHLTISSELLSVAVHVQADVRSPSPVYR